MLKKLTFHGFLALKKESFSLIAFVILNLLGFHMNCFGPLKLLINNVLCSYSSFYFAT